MEFGGHEDAIRWYETERDNLVAAIHAAEAAGLHSLAWQLLAVLRRIYAFRTPVEWISTSLIGLDAARHGGARSGEADLLESLGMAHVQTGRIEEALAYHRQALAWLYTKKPAMSSAKRWSGMGSAWRIFEATSLSWPSSISSSA